MDNHRFRNTSIALTVTVILAGCQAAVITSAKWDSGLSVSGSSSIETRCQDIDMRDNESMAKLFPKYDGWKMVYVSEYTTGNKLGTSSAVCFERAKK